MTMLNDIHTQNLPVIKFYAFNPLQPRGKNGMWTHGGEAAAHAGLRQDARKNKLYSIAARHHAQQLGHEAAGAITNGHDVADHLARMGKAVTALRVQAYHSRKKGNMEDAHVRMAAANHYAAMRKGLKMHAKGKGEMPDMEAFGDSHVAAAKASFAQQAKDRAAHGDKAQILEGLRTNINDLKVGKAHQPLQEAAAMTAVHLANAHSALAAGDTNAALDHFQKAKESVNETGNSFNLANVPQAGQAKKLYAMAPGLAGHLKDVGDALKDSPEVAHDRAAAEMHKHMKSLPAGSERDAADRASRLHKHIADMARGIRTGQQTGALKDAHKQALTRLGAAMTFNPDDKTKASLEDAAKSLKGMKSTLDSRDRATGKKVAAEKIDGNDLSAWHSGQEWNAKGEAGKGSDVPNAHSAELAKAHNALSWAHSSLAGDNPVQAAAREKIAASHISNVESGAKDMPLSAGQQKHLNMVKASHKLLLSRMKTKGVSVQPIDASAPKDDTAGVKPDTASSADTGELPKAIVGEKADAAYHAKSSKALSEMADAAPAGSQHRATIKAMADAHKHLALLSAAKIKSSQQVKDGDPDAHKKNAAQLGEHLDNAKNALSNATYTAVPAGPLRDHMESLGADTGGKFGTSLSPEDAKHESQIDGTHTADMWKQSEKTSKAKADEAAASKSTKPDYETKAGDALLGAHSSKGTLHDAFSHVHNALKSLMSGDAEGAKAHLAKALPLAAKTVANHPLAGLLNDSIKAAQDGVSAGNQPEAGKPTPPTDSRAPLPTKFKDADVGYKGPNSAASYVRNNLLNNEFDGKMANHLAGKEDYGSDNKSATHPHGLPVALWHEQSADLKMKKWPDGKVTFHTKDDPNATKGTDVPGKGVAQSNSGHDLENPQFTEGEHKSVAGEVENSQGKNGSINYSLGTANNHIADAYAKLKSGDKAGAQDSYEKAQAASYGMKHLGIAGSRTKAIADYTKKGLDKVGAAIKGAGQKVPEPTPVGKPAKKGTSTVFTQEAHTAAAASTQDGMTEDGNKHLADFHAAMKKGDLKAAHTAWMGATVNAQATENSWKGEGKTPEGKLLIKGAKHASSMISNLPGPRAKAGFDEIKAAQKEAGDSNESPLGRLSGVHSAVAQSFVSSKGPDSYMTKAQDTLDGIKKSDLPADMQHHHDDAQKLVDDAKAFHAGNLPEPTPPATPKPGKTPKEATNHAKLAADFHSDAKAEDKTDHVNGGASAEHNYRMVGDAHEHLDQMNKALAKGDTADAAAHAARAWRQISLVHKDADKVHGKAFAAAHKLALNATADALKGPLKGVQGSEFTKDEMSRAKSTATMHATNAQTLKDKGYMTAGEGTDHIGKAYAAIGRGDSKAAALHAQNAIDTIKSGVEPAGASDLHQEIRRQGHNILSHVKEFSPKA